MTTEHHARNSGTDSTGGPTRRALALSLLGGAAGAAVVLIASGQTWAEGMAEAAGGALPVTADGSDVSGLPSALALTGLAALVAVFAVRRTGRRIVSALLAFSGAAALATSLLGARDTGALERAAAEATGLTGAAVTAAEHTAWPWVSAIGGLLLVGAGVLALRHGARWPAMSGRYERDGRRPRRRAQDPGAPDALWKALDRGEDPT